MQTILSCTLSLIALQLVTVHSAGPSFSKLVYILKLSFFTFVLTFPLLPQTQSSSQLCLPFLLRLNDHPNQTRKHIESLQSLHKADCKQTHRLPTSQPRPKMSNMAGITYKLAREVLNETERNKLLCMYLNSTVTSVRSSLLFTSHRRHPLTFARPTGRKRLRTTARPPAIASRP